uniref:Uncharacterized protein n=1 Tax=uncultured marine virus TaxID=186617 RepID=A0A0F7L904_9VIRU|nr:hypothetical protein [uncultured marine virus]
MTSENQAIGANGTFQVSGTSKVTRPFYAFHAEDGSTLTGLTAEINGVDTDVRDLILETVTDALMGNTLFRLDNNVPFTSITPASGKFNLFNKNA